MPPQRRWAPALAALPILLALALDPIAGLTAPARAEPVARMGHLIDVEHSLGAFFEPSLHAWVAARPLLLHTLDITYVGVHLPLTLGVLAWVWVARRDAFPFARNTFLAAQTLSAMGYLLGPTAPPRMVRGLEYSA